MRIFVGIVSILGVLVFGAAFVASYVNPTFVESIGREVVRREVEHRVDEKIASLENTRIVSLAERMLGRNKMDIAKTRQLIEGGLPQKIAAVIAEMRNANCPCRNKIERTVVGFFNSHVDELKSLDERLTELIRSKYLDVAAALTREFRIFTGANAIVFALLGLTVLLRKQATVQLILPTIVLLGAASIVGYLYLFQQNWLHTIVFGDYVGLAYFGYLGVAVLFLADIAFNRARVIATLFGGVAGAVPVLPC
jgi:hypothetical protein